MCPGINLLKTYKVYPRVHQFNYMKDLFFIYIYLDPFKPYKQPFKVNVQNEDFCFAYEPFYLGKGTGAGYRHNQHLVAFQQGHENNSFKIRAFKTLTDNLAEAAAKQEPDTPWNLKEYKDRYIVILKTFETPEALLKFEMEFINKLGTQMDHKGPLTNKIKNAYKFEKLSSGRLPEL